MRNLFLFFIIFHSIINSSRKNENPFNSVEHKNLQLNLYLDFISYNCQEKVGILPYILKNSKGIYLEIGTGGDPIAKILNKIPSTMDVLIIASDIDSDILKSLLIRNPDLEKYLQATTGPKLKLQKLNAIHMNIFENNFFDGINASSLLHEIFSYENGFKGIEKFFKEAFRVLKIGGVLIYRDPEGVANKQSIVTLELKNKLVRLFGHIFIFKFLEKGGSFLGKKGRKIELYNSEKIIFNIYKKNETDAVNLTYKQYLEVPSYDIDFSRSYKIILPFGLYRELARHYLTYLHQCNALAFVQYTPNIYSDFYKVNYFVHSTFKKLNNFLKKYGWQIVNEQINIEKKSKIEEYIDNNSKVLEFGVPLHFSSKIKESQLRSLLKKYGFSPGNYIIALDNGDCLLDYRIFGVLYDEIDKQIFDQFNGLVNKKDDIHAKWLKREGEEFYFNYAEDELIAKVAEITMVKDKDIKGKESFFVLCPLSDAHSMFVHRICYTEFLNHSLGVTDSLGYPVEVKDGKRVIHFCKMRLKDALKIYKKIIESNPMNYPHLQQVIKDIETKLTQ